MQCNEDDLAIFYEGRGEETYDSRVVSRATWSDIDSDAVEDYRRERAKVSPDAEELGWSDEELLHSLDCVRKNGVESQPTIAGVLLFGTKPALRRLFPLMRVDYIRVPGREWVPNPDQRFDSIDMRDPLMRVVRRSLSAILDDFSQPFSLPEGEAQREATQALPPRALREALVNAVMHRSYRQDSPVQIIVTPIVWKFVIRVIRSKAKSVGANRARSIAIQKLPPCYTKRVSPKPKVQECA